MAPEMQFVPVMMRAKATILSVILMASFSTGAFAQTEEESVCVKSFRKANTEFFKSHKTIENRQSNSMYSAAIVGAAGVACVGLRRTVAGLVACSAGATAIGGSAYGYSKIQESKLQRLFDAHRLYTAYYSTIDETADPSEYTTQFVSDLGVDVNKEKEVLKDMAGLMKWGALCEGEQPRSYEEVLEIMKQRLHAAQ